MVCGVNDVAVQGVVNAMNSLLGSYGNTIDLDNPLFSHQGDETAFAELVDRMAGREIGAAFFYGANPAYDYPEAAKFTEALKNVRMKVSFADRVDETADRKSGVNGRGVSVREDLVGSRISKKK